MFKSVQNILLYCFKLWVNLWISDAASYFWIDDTGGRVSFYAFRDDSLYQAGQTNQQGQEHSNQISRDAYIVAETLLSATVHDVDDGNLSDLEENITISFQRLSVINCSCLWFFWASFTHFCWN